ncbi:Oxidoreductase ptaJ [Penicillium subrubescens]|uniref:Oxidoreductase AflY n=1 Tax=Penicillium subrubescens TaxID=1316194 RepID=A0A1Q5TLB2_9EURO|nr:Oxidoreductase ptaJ [Penicillium subrubescens]KAJ5906668.1 Oxidoreductase ptaJ [Penicillium subrubescens]OKP01023.1 Oxidoreductase AflY [Penicillium subrubescens]
MATARKIHLSPETDTGIFSSGVREDTARAASEALQLDMEKHHVFFNEQGFHNHIPHMLLSIYALGGTPEDIRAAYERSQSYQRKAVPVNAEVVDKLNETGDFKEYLGKGKNYSNFLSFFQRQIDEKGVDAVLNEYVFAGNEQAENMLCRVWGGLIHPLIHLGFGLEFNQPAIVAQALAQAAVHDDSLGRDFFLPAEKMAGEIGKPGSKSLRQLLEEIRKDEILSRSARTTDVNKIRDGVLTRAPQEMLKYAAQYTVSEDQLEERLADMINNVVYYTSAAQRPNKAVKLDFFFIHCLNSSIFFSKLVHLPALSQQTRLRLLEWKGRMDLLMYVSRGCPELLRDDITNYPAKNDWTTLFARAASHPKDDGHLAKFVRAVAHGENVCKSFESQGQQAMPVSGNMWLQIGNMAIDSTVGDEDAMWIRSTGFDEAWEHVPGRARL